MSSATSLICYREADVAHLTVERANEPRVWQHLAYLDSQSHFSDALKDAAQFGIRYVLVGIPEDIGPRANCGLGGATQGWQAFLKRFLNIASNQFLDASKILLLGEVDCRDLQQAADQLTNQGKDLQQLRELCELVDQRVAEVLSAIFSAGLEPLVIGGGHNNAYGILKGLHRAKQTQVNAINCDPHADFRSREGRHSGNSFSYAYHEGILSQYHVIGLHEQKNNQAIISGLCDAGATFNSYQELYVRRTTNLTQACERALQRFNSKLPLGIEVDVDCISGMPVSAFTNCGMSVSDVEHFVHLGASQKQAAYLHLCEAAPGNHANGLAQGMNEAGQVLSALVCSYLQARQARHLVP
ncbi:formimidoylglutamase [Pseudoalteromonas fenneropenaei]|uniref:Formimidoylglutamase n=1 Tax=Pseudoalteromonas fenneropenaei TaxID=1737459 RepID=A0ABV7CK38_9GAMM